MPSSTLLKLFELSPSLIFSPFFFLSLSLSFVSVCSTSSLFIYQYGQRGHRLQFLLSGAALHHDTERTACRAEPWCVCGANQSALNIESSAPRPRSSSQACRGKVGHRKRDRDRERKRHCWERHQDALQPPNPTRVFDNLWCHLSSTLRD